VIARIWHGYTKPEHAEAYEKLLKPELLPGLSKVKGFKGSYLLKKTSEAEVEFVTVMLWESIDDIRSVGGPNYEIAIVPENRRELLTRFDERATHYEIASTYGLVGL
jgi:Antibiotic biosynthesis monooxygenase